MVKYRVKTIKKDEKNLKKILTKGILRCILRT